MLVPGGIGAHPVIYILERKAESFRVVFVNTDPLRGLRYHISTADQPPKMKYFPFLPSALTAKGVYIVKVQTMPCFRRCAGGTRNR
jgi:hypothetical protein